MIYSQPPTESSKWARIPDQGGWEPTVSEKLSNSQVQSLCSSDFQWSYTPARHQKNNIISTRSRSRRRRQPRKTVRVCVFIKCWIVENERNLLHPCGLVLRVASTGSKSTELFTPVKIAFVLLQRPLSREGKEIPPNPTTHKTHNWHPPEVLTGKKLVDEWQTLGKFIRLIAVQTTHNLFTYE